MFKDSFETIHSLYEEFPFLELIKILRTGEIIIKIKGKEEIFKDSWATLTYLDGYEIKGNATT